MAEDRAAGKQRVDMPPLRPYEQPDGPTTVLPLPHEKDTFVIPGEHPTAVELRSLPRPVILPPLRPDEMPATAVRVLAAVPDRVLDEPEWGTAKKVPEIPVGKGKLLHPWDE
ncbi:MAG: hypothetical protein M0Q92_04365 [Methanoregula sp.]|nr:hypothetical protein [Methanoregula sp.]